MTIRVKNKEKVSDYMYTQKGISIFRKTFVKDENIE